MAEPRFHGFAVYRITCRPIGWHYIGATSGFQHRWLTHQSLLRRGLHYNKELQADWLRFGPEAFEVVLLLRVECPRRWKRPTVDNVLVRLKRAECKWIEHYLARGKCYNKNAAGGAYPT